MAEETKSLPNNMLTAEELLENKGLKYNAWDEYEKSSKTLPKTGMKQFEPNNSWLENMQIEKGIMTRKNLIAVERVDRISQLASAEWLPAQKRAKVKKYSGQDWSNFGLEKNGTLYLIPEEALFLLEANCLELTWNDVPLSIQQAYDLLIDNVQCSLEEYRVYSQLVRHGYRIQRFIYNSERHAKVDENNSIKRKVIVEPENGLRMTDHQQLNKDSANSNNSSVQPYENVTECKDIQNCVYEIVNDLLCAVENIEARSRNVQSGRDTHQENLNINSQTMNTSVDKKKRKSKVEIISEETLLGNIKIVKDRINDSTNRSNTSMSWRASRIQRNVKLLPKRTDKAPLLADNLDTGAKNSEECLEKYKSTSPDWDNSQAKKSRHEVIELSDDEIQEVPKPMTRMELLNLIPNIALQTSVTIKIPRGYIPHNVKPCKSSYQYESGRLRNLQESDKTLRYGKNLGHSNNNGNRTVHHFNNASTSNNSRRNTSVVPFNQNLGTNVHNVYMQDYYSMLHGQHTNFDPGYPYNSRMPYAYSHNMYWHHRNTTLQNVYLTLDNQSTAIHQNRYTTVHTNNISIPNIVVENVSIQCSVARNVLLQEPRQRYGPRNRRRNTNMPNRKADVCQSSFKVLPGASSWSELKSKWREEKTIIIDDEDTGKDKMEDCSEVQVVRQLRSPLVGPKNANSLEEVFSKLKIIKSAPEKIVRRKKSKYKISYNVYSNTQNYRKANPGLPFYRVVIIRPDDPFIQPIELQRLMQDADNSPIILACVSMSISYIQPGFISVPNLT